ncbi:MAG: aminotransferase class V-fold PLP-dependent enzyme, partial [Terriglobia bacterium]
HYSMPIDVNRYRLEFPLVRSCTYLNHAAVSPVPCRVSEAMTGLIKDVQLFGASHFEDWLRAVETVRSSAARLLNTAPADIAFVRNTSEGISLFANGLEWQKGDEVVLISGEFPANYYPWKALEPKGVHLKLVPQEESEIRVESIARAITRRTRVVAVSFVQFLSGFRLDLSKLGDLCAANNVLLLVDAIQGWGAFPIDVKAAKIAALAAGGHKWLMGPSGCGILFVREDLTAWMKPSIVGWWSVEGWEDFVSHQPVWRKGAGRFESGTPNFAGIYGFGAALEFLAEIGMEAISERVLELTARLRRGLLQMGYPVYGPTAPEACSGIVTFPPRERGVNELMQRFHDHNVMISARSGMLRVSPHFYNTETEIDRVLELLSYN